MNPKSSVTTDRVENMDAVVDVIAAIHTPPYIALFQSLANPESDETAQITER